MRKIIGDGLRVPHENHLNESYAALFILGKSSKPNAPFADAMVLEIEADGERYLVPLDLVFKMIDRAINPTTEGPR